MIRRYIRIAGRMAVIAILLVLLFGFEYWFNKKNEIGKDVIKSIVLCYKWQLMSSVDNKVLTIDDSLNIYYFKDLLLYEIPHPYELKNVVLNKDNDLVSQKLLKEGVRFSYFIYQANDRYGFEFDSLNSAGGKKYRVDSFLNAKLVINESMFDNANDSLIERRNNYKNYDLFEMYIPKRKYDETYPDSGYYYYSNLMTEIPYSFSKKIDSLKGSKLSKVVFKYNAIPIGKNPYASPEREFKFEIRNFLVINKDEMINFFERFRKL